MTDLTSAFIWSHENSAKSRQIEKSKNPVFPSFEVTEHCQPIKRYQLEVDR